MDIQLFATDEELREFSENKTDSSTAHDKTPSPKDINLMASDLPRSHSDLPKISSRLTDCKSKCKTRRSHRHKSWSKNCTSGHSAVQVNDPLDSIRRKQWVIQTTHTAYLNQLVEHSAGQPVVSQPMVGQPMVGQPMVSQPIVSLQVTAPPVVGQPGHPVPPLLSLWLQPNLNTLARTLSPQALWYIHISIQIDRNLLNKVIMDKAPDGSVVNESSSDEKTAPTMGGAGKCTGKCGDGNSTGGVGPRPCREPRPHSPGSIDELIAALHEATLNPVHPRHHALNPLLDEDRRRPKVKIQPPVFKGLPGERPDADLLAASDWMEAMRIGPNDFIDNFKHTLQHLAHEWYHGLNLNDFHGNWHDFTTHFSRYFSKQGRNIKHLHERWWTFSFDPSTDDIEECIRDVREAAKQLGHGDDTVLNLLKATMPTELYGT